MAFYIYRLDYDKYLKCDNTGLIRNSLEEIEISQGDKAIIVVSKSLMVLGAYAYDDERNAFILIKGINRPVTDFYGKLPMVNFVGERTYKLFAKRLRQIDEANYNAFLLPKG